MVRAQDSYPPEADGSSILLLATQALILGAFFIPFLIPVIITILAAMKLIDLSYYTYHEGIPLAEVVRRQKESHGYLPYLQQGGVDVKVINHMPVEASLEIDGTTHKAFKGSNSFFHIPWKTHRYIKEQRPDAVIVQGLLYPLQVIALRYRLGRQTTILVQHHGERPPAHPVKRFFLRLSDKYVDAYLFTSAGNAEEWLALGAISHAIKVHEVLEASTYLQQQDKELSRQALGMSGTANFLWVGRLNRGKDPLTVLKGFHQYSLTNPTAALYMIYQDDDLLGEVKAFISTSGMQNVHLVGRVAREQLAQWYSAADFYLSGSHREGSGYALIECMACGCIPVVTDIPPFRAITGGGQYGLLYTPGDADSLYRVLLATQEVNQAEFSSAISGYFKERLSFKSIADRIYKLCSGLIAAKK